MEEMIDNWLFNAEQAEVAYRAEQLYGTRRNISNRRRFRRHRSDHPVDRREEPALAPVRTQAEPEPVAPAEREPLAPAEPEREHAAANMSGKVSVR
jgi:hypothetical protein